MTEELKVMPKDEKGSNDLEKLNYYVNAIFQIIDRTKSEKNGYAISRAIDGLQDVSIWGSAAYHKKD